MCKLGCRDRGVVFFRKNGVSDLDGVEWIYQVPGCWSIDVRMNE